HALATAAGDVEEVRVAKPAVVVLQCQRHEDIGLRRPPERHRQDADNFVRVSVERHAASHDRRIHPKPSLPQTVRQDCNTIAAQRFFLRAKVASQYGLNTKNGEKCWRYRQSTEPLRSAAA